VKRRARLRTPALVLAASLAANVGGRPAVAAQAVREPSFGSGVSVVRIAVVVRDAKGAPVRDLTRGDFTLLEDDRPQTITSFDFEEVPTESAPAAEPGAPPSAAPPTVPPAPSAAPILAPIPSRPALSSPAPATAIPVDLSGRRLVVLLFDASAMEPDELQRAVDSAREYVDERMSAADSVAVAAIGTTGLEVAQDFTTDRDLLRRAIARVGGTGESGDDTSFVADQSVDTSDTEGFSGDTSELDLFDIDRRLRAIEDLADALSPIQQKKSVIYYSSGTTGATPDNQVELRAAIDRSVKANVAVYPVDTRGLEAVVPGGEARQASAAGVDTFSGRALERQLDEQATSQDALSSLARDTGGQPFFDTNDWSGVYERVLADTSAYYVLGYVSTNGAQDGKFRHVRVRVDRPGLKVEHRSGYYAPRDFSHSRKEDREHQLEDQLLADISARDFPVWLQASYFRIGDTRYYVPVSIALPGSAVPFVRKGQEDRATLDLIGVVYDEADRAVGRLRDTVTVRAAGTEEVRRKNVQYQTGFVLPPGRYRAKVVVRENQEGSFGSFETTITVPDLRAAKLKVSSVVVGTQLQPDDHGDERNPLIHDGSELLPSVTHVVTTAQTLHFYYEVYDPARAPSGGPRLQTTISFLRGRVRRYETPPVELTRVAASDRKAAVFQLSVPPGSLAPGYYVCQVNVIDDVAGTFTFPRLALLVRP
jgi:VWFA-related protein